MSKELYRVFGEIDCIELRTLNEAGTFYFEPNGFAVDAKTDRLICYHDYMDTVHIRLNKFLESRIIRVKEKESPEAEKGFKEADDIMKLLLTYKEARKKHGFKQVMNLIMAVESEIVD